ncbi:hypothetical protein ACFWHQ_29835 [Streptomyces sp. NPDC060334]|uniref:hypothetical protein n=1 Tax=Streptomyces sp. NPDC060334 TaxID=3347099 RepID=UPI00366A0C74
MTGTQGGDRERLRVEQRELLAVLGVPAAPKPVEPARPRRAASDAFDQGVEALAQYAAREARVVVPRAHSEELPEGTAVEQRERAWPTSPSTGPGDTRPGLWGL